MISLEERKRYYEKAIEKGDKPKEINCIIGKWELPKKEMKITISNCYPTSIENFHEYPVVFIYNEKLQTWQAYGLVQYKDVCPICGTLMLVRAVAGTTWLACCSEECYKKYDEERKDKHGK